MDNSIENNVKKPSEGQAPSALQSEASNELSRSAADAGTLSKHAGAKGNIDQYKDLISQRLQLEAEKNAQDAASGKHAPELPQPKASDRPPDSPATSTLEDKLSADSSKMSESEKSEFNDNMQAFLNRAHAQGLNEKSEVDTTLAACDRLLNPDQNGLYLDGLFGKEKAEQMRTMLAEQIMKEAAYPSNTDQGHYGTCPVASLETRTWFDNPSVASSIIADQALTGQWVAHDGHVVKLPQMDFTPDKYSQMASPPDGMRSYSGQLFQATALSDVGSRLATPQYYAVGGIVKNENGHEVGVEFWSDANGKKVAEYEGLEDVPNAQEMKRLDGDNTEILCSDPAEAGSGANVVIFNGKEDLKEKLKEAQESGKMPVIITVSALDKFFGPTSPGEGHELDHDICIDKYDPETGNLVIDNQWGSRYDWGTTSVLGATKDVNPVTNIDDFFPATQGQAGVDNSLRL